MPRLRRQGKERRSRASSSVRVLPTYRCAGNQSNDLHRLLREGRPHRREATSEVPSVRGCRQGPRKPGPALPEVRRRRPDPLVNHEGRQLALSSDADPFSADYSREPRSSAAADCSAPKSALCAALMASTSSASSAMARSSATASSSRANPPMRSPCSRSSFSV